MPTTLVTLASRDGRVPAENLQLNCQPADCARGARGVALPGRHDGVAMQLGGDRGWSPMSIATAMTGLGPASSSGALPLIANFAGRPDYWLEFASPAL